MNDLVNLVNAYFTNNNITYDSTLEENSISQELQSFLYPVTKDNNFKKYYIASFITSEKFNNLKDEINELLNKEKIKHIFVKGIILKKLYKDESIRRMGDIDFLVLKKDYIKAKKILEKNGYVKNPKSTCDHHIGFKKDNLEIELHQSLFNTDDERYEYFLDAFNHSYLVNEYEYLLDDTYHFLYILCHFEHHILHGGAGIRNLIDIKLLKEKVDNEELNKMLKDLNLEEFYMNVLNLSCYLFDLSIKLDDNQIEFLDFLLTSGIHGYDNQNKSVISFAGKKKESKFKYILRKAFPKIESLKATYPVLNKCIILAPFFYVYRIIGIIFKKNKEARMIVFSKKEEVDKINEFFNKIGLNK